jgi:nucleoside diphosphate kinase
MKIILKKDFHFFAIRRLILTKEDVECIYIDSRNDCYFENHCRFMQSGPVTAFIVGSDCAIQRLNELVGYTIPAQASSGCIRCLGVDICRNLIHSSSNFHDFVRDSQAIFKGYEFEHFYEEL